MSQEIDSSVYPGAISTYIIFAGMLVRVGSVMELADNHSIGLIIKRNEVGLGFNEDWWEVLVNGSIIRLTGTSIWPMDDYEQELIWR